jgi:pyruvate/2-oxoglutarate dehydrogenase complex dihydrolipoamide acyltransferase (E2) component
MPHEVTMPQLGMAQDTGRLTQWLKQPGEEVARGDLLFEVETDKATMEIEAQADGFLTHVTADEGTDIPVGQVIARISDTADAPEETAQAEAPAIPPAKPIEASPEEPTDAQPEPDRSAPREAAKPEAEPFASQPGARILASPKLRRIAASEGLDLTLLARADHPQPYHMRDLDRLRELARSEAPRKQAPGQAAGMQQPAAMRLRATCPQDGFAGFARWAAGNEGLEDADALLAGLAGISLGSGATCVAVERIGTKRVYSVPDTRRLSAVTPGDAQPELLVRDLRACAVESVEAGAETLPVLTITRCADGLSISLECSPDQLDATGAIALLDQFAGRMRDPLRHLL